MPNTKADFIEILFQVIDPLRTHYSDGKALVKLGYTGTTYDERCEEFEGFSRPLWGLVPFFYGGGEDTELITNYLTGLENGVNPESLEYWGGFKNTDQRFCEMASIALGLILIPEKIWEPLPETAKDNLVTWLNAINQYELPDNNWQFFRVMVNVSLKKLGVTYDEAMLESALEAINANYMSDGWYHDGQMYNIDYYNGFAFHFYGLIYATIMQEEDPIRSLLFKERALIFAREYIYLFDDKGDAVPYGRSMTYRFGVASFFSACLFADISPYSVGVMKGIIARHLSNWFDAPIFDNGGILSIGYKYPNLLMAENYNAPGSPMWALKTFLILGLEDEHVFWSTEIEELPILDAVKTLEQPRMIITRDSDSTTMYPGGSYGLATVLGNMAEKYSKLVYSSKYGFSVQKANDYLDSMAPDSSLIFEVDGFFYSRHSASNQSVEDGKIISTWSPVEGITVQTIITPYANGHTREHIIQSEIECTAYEGGFALDTQAENYSQTSDDNSASIQSAQGNCTITGGLGSVIVAYPNSNLISARTAIPIITRQIGIGETTLNTIVDFE